LRVGLTPKRERRKFGKSQRFQEKDQTLLEEKAGGGTISTAHKSYTGAIPRSGGVINNERLTTKEGKSQ